MGDMSVSRREPGVLDAATNEVWDLVTRKAATLAKSSVIPSDYRDKPANVLVAMEMAQRTDLPVLAVMQNLHIINGRPSWSAQFLISAVNRSGHFSPLRYRFQGEEGTDEWGCRAVALDRASGEELVGALITIGMARAEGWSTKSGSKWKTMPEQMLRYRAASFWARVYSPEITVGLMTAEEAEDAPSPARVHAATVLAALHADEDPIPEGEWEPGEDFPDVPTEEPAASYPDDPQGRYLAALAAHGMDNDADRRAFQKRLHAEGVVSTDKMTAWSEADYAAARTVLNTLPTAGA